MKPLTIWAANTQAEIPQSEPLVLLESGKLSLAAYLTSDSLWLLHTWSDGSRIGFRTAFSTAGKLEVKAQKKEDGGFRFDLECSTLKYRVFVRFPQDETLVFRYTVQAEPKLPLLLPYWPKDILSFEKNGKVREKGEIHTQQTGTRSGTLFFNDRKSGSVFYFQNLTALNDYCQATETSAAGVVGGEWPEIGFSLPLASKPLEAGQLFTLSDAFVRLDPAVLKEASEVSMAFLNHLAETYLVIPRPERHYHNWLETVERGLDDLYYHKGCWTFGGGHNYLNAYVADYKTPPEVMVQLAVLLPMIEYMEWKGEKSHRLVDDLKAGLPAFYKEDMKTIVRWLPALERNLDHSEEQKKPDVMDSWYLHHPLMNLARLAERGDEIARKLLMDSIDYVIRVAHEFNYEWPVFYQMNTLKVIKAETTEGAGGEKDVPGTYADVMLRVWKLTGEKKYFQEAVKAAKKLKGLGFQIFYQANNTAYGAGAMLRLYKETKDETYLKLSYDCLAGIFNNVQLWECDYGHAKNFPTFFSVFPLKDAPYTAAYEEEEVYAALHNYLKESEGVDILPSVRLLITEFIRHMVGRVCYYFPTLLPKDMLVEKSKTGEIDPKLWVALEDLHDGWEQCGEVGQEVYGAGICFGVIPRQYVKVPAGNFTLFCDYPIQEVKISKSSARVQLNGDPRLSCRVIVLTDENAGEKYSYTATVNGSKNALEPVKQESELTEFSVPGGQSLKINWKLNR
jgi:hypothetical protein